MRSHLHEPITIPRWALVVKYAFFVLLGMAVLWASSPAVDEVSPDWLTPIWGLGISTTAAAALVGSLTPRLEKIEMIGVTLLAALFVVFAIAPVVLVIQGDADRAVYSVIAAAFSVLTILRSLQLFREGGRPAR